MTLLLCFHKQLLTLIYSNLGPVAAFRAAGDIRYAMTLTFFSMFTFRVGLSYLLCKVFSMDLMGVDRHVGRLVFPFDPKLLPFPQRQVVT